MRTVWIVRLFLGDTETKLLCYSSFDLAERQLHEWEMERWMTPRMYYRAKHGSKHDGWAAEIEQLEVIGTEPGPIKGQTIEMTTEAGSQIISLHLTDEARSLLTVAPLVPWDKAREILKELDEEHNDE